MLFLSLVLFVHVTRMFAKLRTTQKLNSSIRKSLRNIKKTVTIANRVIKLCNDQTLTKAFEPATSYNIPIYVTYSHKDRPRFINYR